MPPRTCLHLSHSQTIIFLRCRLSLPPFPLRPAVSRGGGAETGQTFAKRCTSASCSAQRTSSWRFSSSPVSATAVRNSAMSSRGQKAKEGEGGSFLLLHLLKEEILAIEEEGRKKEFVAERRRRIYSRWKTVSEDGLEEEEEAPNYGQAKKGNEGVNGSII